jgi:Ser/Thr protein kinase RdoA (MazF antagonist)
VHAFVRGYRAHHRLDDDLFAALPLFSRLSRLLVYARLVRSLDLPDRPDQPEWLRGLRRKFEAITAAYATSLSR